MFKSYTLLKISYSSPWKPYLIQVPHFFFHIYWQYITKRSSLKAYGEQNKITDQKILEPCPIVACWRRYLNRYKKRFESWRIVSMLELYTFSLPVTFYLLSSGTGTGRAVLSSSTWACLIQLFHTHHTQSIVSCCFQYTFLPPHKVALMSTLLSKVLPPIQEESEAKIWIWWKDRQSQTPMLMVTYRLQHYLPPPLISQPSPQTLSISAYTHLI